MTDPNQPQLCLIGCQAPVPPELQEKRLCVLHFILSTEHDCTRLRRETAMEKANATRRSEIADYIKTTAMKLSEVAIGNVPLSDDLKKRILTTFLTLMNLRESLDRSARRCVQELRVPRSPVAAVPGPSPSALLVRLRA
jgi:hypothetical protein